MQDFFLRVLWCSTVSFLAYFFLGHLSHDMATFRLPLTFLFTSPLWAQNFTKYLIEIIPAIRRHAHRSAHESWNGRYYAYEGNHIRFYLVDDIIWIAAADIKHLLLPAPDSKELRLLAGDHAIIPGQKIHGYTQTGLLRLLALRTNKRLALPEMIKFRRWVEYEALPNVKRLPASSAKSA